jgi:hypothetical protein
VTVIACCALHYGREYLEHAVRSVQDVVDEVHILYSSKPTFGHTTYLPCPDSETDLLAAALRGSVKKPVIWHRGRWRTESAHRDAFHAVADEARAEVIVVLDADEVWEQGTLALAVEQAAERPEAELRVRLVHFWRSLHWVCTDAAMPVRLLKPAGSGEGYLDGQAAPVLHLGYAQSAAVVAYKQEIHGHKAEWRPGWLEEKFLPWLPDTPIADVHPTCADGFWNPVPVDDETAALVRRLLGDHPYMEAEWIP